MSFEGVYAAIVCPMSNDGRIDEESLGAHVQNLTNTPGMSGLLCNGHAGENHVLTPVEKRQVVAVCRRAAPHTQLIVGLNGETPAAVAAEAGDAEAEGADAVMIFPPFSWALGHDASMAIGHHQSVLQSCTLPLFLYQASVGAGRMGYTTSTLAKLLTLPRIAGVKEGSWEFCAYENTLTLARQINPGAAVMASGDEHLFPCFALGTQGSIVSLASVIPEAIIALYEAVENGAMDTARRLHEPIQILSRVIYGNAGSAAQPTLRLKLALSQRGEIAGAHMRAPVSEPPDGIEDTLRKALEGVRDIMATTASVRAEISQNQRNHPSGCGS